jgi:hypothetical protein
MVGGRLVASLGQGHGVNAAETGLTGFPLPLKAEGPLLGTGRSNGKIKAATVGEFAGLRSLDLPS